MGFDNRFELDSGEQIENWGAEENIATPDEELISKGYEAEYQPPAHFFNWFWNKVIKCINEIQATINDLIVIVEEKAIRIIKDKSVNMRTTGGGFQAGENATSQYGGVAIGKDANAAAGGAVGQTAITSTGGSIGVKTKSGTGGAVGAYAETNDGFAGGFYAVSGTGGAVGRDSNADKGGAVGYNAKTGDGFAGGFFARAVDADGNGIDAVQLGKGTNNKPRSVKAYDYELMDPDGNIPSERMDERMVFGTYVGKGSSTENTVFANLGYKPKKIEIVPAAQGNFSITMLMRDCPFSAVMRSSNENYGIALNWTTSGVKMTPAGEPGTNAPTVICDIEGVTYHYIIHR